MAERKAEFEVVKGKGGQVLRVTWRDLGPSDTGEPVLLGKGADKTVQIRGTFNGNTITMQGSMNIDEAVPIYFTLTDNQGVNIALTAASGKLIAENPVYIRPSNSAEASTDNIVELCVT